MISFTNYFNARRWQTMVLIFVTLCLAACQQEREEKLVLLTSGGAIKTAVDNAVKGFLDENPGVEVQIITAPGQDYYVKSLTMLAGRAHVDILWMGQGFGMFASRGALLDLAPYVDGERSKQSTYQKKVMDWYRFGDKLYGAPYGVDLLTIGYNKDLFDAAGLPYPTPEWSLIEMLETAKRLTRMNPDGTRTEVAGLGFVDLDYRYYGLSLLSEDYRRFALNTDEGKTWMRKNLELIYRDNILQRGSDMETIDRLTGFLNGQVAMVNLANWDMPQLEEQAPFRWGVVPVPLGIGRKRVTWASSSGFSIARHSKQPDLAWKLLKKLTGRDFQRTVMAHTIPMEQELHAEYLKADKRGEEQANAFLDSLNSMEPSPRIAAFQEVESEWNYWRDRALLKQISVEEALEQAESHINRILDLHHTGATR